MTSYEQRYMHVAAVRANEATIYPDSQNYFITLYIAVWVIRCIMEYTVSDKNTVLCIANESMTYFDAM